MTRDQVNTLARVAAMLARRTQDTNAARDAERLCSISRSLSRISERGCNEDRHCRRCEGSGTGSRATRPSMSDVAVTTYGPCPACSGTGSLDGKRERRLEAEARGIAKRYGCRVYFQGDPRGAAVYLIPEEAGPEADDPSWYSSRGTAAY